MHILQTPCTWYFVLNSGSNLVVPDAFVRSGTVITFTAFTPFAS